MGNEAEHIFKLFAFNEEGDEKRFDIVLRKYNEYCGCERMRTRNDSRDDD